MTLLCKVLEMTLGAPGILRESAAEPNVCVYISDQPIAAGKRMTAERKLFEYSGRTLVIEAPWPSPKQPSVQHKIAMIRAGLI